MLLFFVFLFSAIVIKKDWPGNPSAIGHSGPTYIAIRSAKHSSSTALAHGFDFDSLLDLPEFQSVMKIGQDFRRCTQCQYSFKYLIFASSSLPLASSSICLRSSALYSWECYIARTTVVTFLQVVEITNISSTKRPYGITALSDC